MTTTIDKTVTKKPRNDSRKATRARVAKSHDDAPRKATLKEPHSTEEWKAFLTHLEKTEPMSSRNAWMNGFGVWVGDPDELKRLETEVMAMREADTNL